MRRKIQLLIWVFCAAIIYCGAASLLTANEADDVGATEGNDNTAALEWGFKFASAIPVKPHIVDRGKSQYSILEQYLEAGLPDGAAALVDQIADWRRCLFNADLAFYYAEKNDGEKANRYLAAAGACRNGIDGWQAGWQKDRVLLRMAEVQVMAGQWGAVEKTEAELPAEFAARTTALRFSRMAGPEDYERRLNQLQPMESSEHMEVQRDVALAYIGILRQLGKDATAEQRNTLQTCIYALSEKLPLLVQHEVLCSLIRAAFDAGHGDMGREVLNDAVNKLKQRDLNARFDVSILSELAGIWQIAAGDSRRSASLLDEAKKLLANGGLKGQDRITSLTALALGHGICGHEDAAWDYFTEALQIAASLVNARPRAMAITEICNGIAHWGALLPNDMAEALARLYTALGDPW